MGRTMSPERQESKRLFSLARFKDFFAAEASSIVSLGLITLLLIMPSSLPEAYGMERSNPPELRAVTAKPLKTVIVADYFPYTFVNEKGIPDGFAVDIAKAVTHVMGLKVEISVGTWEYAKQALENGTIDFLPMMADTPKRRPLFNFSVPHTIAYDAIFVRKGTPSPSSIEDLAGKSVIVMNKDAAHEYLLSSGISDKIKLTLVDSLPDGLRLLASGKGNALLMPKLVGLILMKQLNITNVEESPLIIDAYRRPFSFAVKEGNNALRERLSQGLSIIKNTGEYEDIYGKWFGALEPRGLPWTTVQKYLFGIASGFLLIGLILLLWSISLRKQVALRTRSLEAEIKRREKTENDLRESEERYRAVFDNAAIGIDTLDRYGKITKVNPALCKMLGYTEDELKELTFEEITHPEDRQISKQKLQSIITGESDSYRLEKRYLRKDGGVVWGDLSTSSIKDANGNHTGAVGVIANISERKQMEEALKRSERRFRELAELLPQTVFEIDMDGKYTFINSAALKLTGYSLEEFFTILNPFQLVIQEDRERVADNIKKLAEGQDVAVNPYTAVRKDGSTFPVLVYAGPISENGKIVGIRGSIVDISPLKQAEEERQKLRTQLFQSQKMEALGTLVGGIAHDFNNMLQIILGYSQLLLEYQKKDDPGKEDLQIIIETVQEGANLVNKLLAFGQQGQVFPAPLDLNNQLRELNALISHTLPKTIKVDMNLTARPTMIMADKGQTDQIVMNLAINAAEAMPNGGNLKISTAIVSLDDDYCKSHLGTKPGDYVKLSVRDNGRGMDNKILVKIFDPFFSTKERGSTRGTGLGLSVVRGIVQQGGGHITCESEPGKGTEFRVYFPAIESEPTTQEKTSHSVQPGGETILVVEHNIPVAELAQRILTNAGYSVITANNGREALEVYRTRKDEISLVILDLLMPEMSGKDCLMELVKIDPSVKVLIASGYAPEDELYREISPLVKGFLHKPFGAIQLLNSAGVVLRGE